MRRKGAPLVKHGFCTRKDVRTKSRKYKLHCVWLSMIGRCYNKTTTGYANYGKRGIRVCARWRNSFRLFVADMGIPRPGLTLGRKDNDKNYTPSNCRWESVAEQANNKRTTRIVEFGGKRMSVANWTKKVGLPKPRLFQRLDRGWSVKDALFRPRKVQKNNARVGS